MNGSWRIVAAALLGLSIIALGDVISEEVRARLDRLPHVIIDWAVRRLPDHFRSDFSEEWEAELTAILIRRNALTLPITRLAVGVRYACGLLRVSREIGRTLGALGSDSGPVPRLRIRRDWSIVAALSQSTCFTVAFIALAVFHNFNWMSRWAGLALAASILTGLVASVFVASVESALALSFSVRAWGRLAGRRFVQFLRVVGCLTVGFLAAVSSNSAIYMAVVSGPNRELGPTTSRILFAIGPVLGAVIGIASLWRRGRAAVVARCLVAGSLLAWLSEQLAEAVGFGLLLTALGWAVGCIGAVAVAAGATAAARWRLTTVPMTMLGSVLLPDAVAIVYLGLPRQGPVGIGLIYLDWAPLARVAALVIGSTGLAAVAVWLATRRLGPAVFGSLLAVASACLVFSFFESLPAHNAYVSCVAAILVGSGTAAVAAAAGARGVPGSRRRWMATATVCTNAIAVVNSALGSWPGAVVLVLLSACSVLPRKPFLVVTGDATPSRQPQDFAAVTHLPQPPI